jgi:hypothetical protein
VAQRVNVVLTDDIEGTTIQPGKGETISFALDGLSFEIDLTNRNAAGLRKALAPYVDAGRVMKGKRGRVAKRTRVGADPRTIKEWARANGYEVKDRGRLPQQIVDAFNAAN